MVALQPTISNDSKTIFGSIIYIDNYGNSISNITEKLIQKIGKGRSFVVKANTYTFTTVNRKYSDIIDFSLPKDQRQKDGSKLAIFNAVNYLEIAMYRSNLDTVGGASSLLGLNYGDIITVTFE